MMINHGVGLPVEATRVNGDGSNGHADGESGNDTINGENKDERMAAETSEPQVVPEMAPTTQPSQEPEQQPPEFFGVDTTALLLLPLLIEDFETRYPSSAQKQELCTVVPDAVAEAAGTEDATAVDT